MFFTGCYRPGGQRDAWTPAEGCPFAGIVFLDPRDGAGEFTLRLGV
jgi:hypothetical protein